MKTPIISTFKEKPKAKIGWWAMGLGLATLLGVPLVSILTLVMLPAFGADFNEAMGQTIGVSLGVFSLLVGAAAIVVGIIAHRRGERSWAVWLGLILAILTIVVWGLMILSDLLTQ
jgi:MFS family permease